MSASTVSITANPTARRRPVVAGDTSKRSPAGLFPDDAVPSVDKDLSQSIEAVIERARDAVQAKKTSSAAALTHARRTSRKPVAAKPEKPKWVTVLRVLTKNLLLLLFLLGFVQLIRRSVYNSGGEEGFPITSGSEFERRIANIEGFVKKTTKMMQVQVEVVDKKLENGLGEVKKDLEGKIEAQARDLSNGLRKLEGRFENSENTLDELKAGEWMKREDFDKFIDEFRKGKGVRRNDDVDLDEVRAVAREIVERELEKHRADGLGRVDYALASGGGAVVKHSDTYGIGRGRGWLRRTNQDGVHDDSVKMLSPSFGEPGQCFPLKGSVGFVQIRLRTAIIPEAVTLEHVAESVAYDRSSAPKDCRVSGWLQKHDSSGLAVETGEMNLLTEFAYDLEKSNAQTFYVLDTPVVVDTIRLDITSNHGNPAHTCIYRLRVHGREPDSIPLLAAQS